MRIVVIVPFLNEERFLARFLASMEAQTRRPDRLVLVDDGSTDGSPAIAAGFGARHDWVTVLTRPPKPPSTDRLALAGEFVAFRWALEQVGEQTADAIGKFDGDIDHNPAALAVLEQALADDPRLGIVGAYLSVLDDAGRRRREHCLPHHVRGPNKLYRRACLDEISPIPAILGWDTIDEWLAQMRGWQTASVALPGGDSIHLRPTGTADGRLRAFRRWGVCSYAIGDPPSWVALGTLRRMGQPPYVLGGLSYALGWALARARRQPRAASDVRRYVRRTQRRRLWWRLTNRGAQPTSP
ncbi:MAG TPA: glycosyltransferase [Conexibacter sp.]|nr:glycosyltransferase [Conexibacter sp.]